MQDAGRSHQDEPLDALRGGAGDLGGEPATEGGATRGTSVESQGVEQGEVVLDEPGDRGDLVERAG